METTIETPNSGKYYVELYWAYLASSLNQFVGLGYFTHQYRANGDIYIDNVKVATVATLASSDIVGICVDIDNDEISFYKNGVLQSTRTTTNLTGLPFFVYSGVNTEIIYINFGQDSTFAGLKAAGGFTDANGLGDFYYAPPTGALALCTANLPAPTFDPASDVTPEDHFKVVLDTGANIKSTAEAVYGDGLIWIKDRDNANNHQLIDYVRGTSAVLQSNTTAAETTYSTPSGNSVAWCFKAGGAPVSNTDGSITSSVSANVDAGFSIVSYTGVGANATVGHGLSQPPDLYMIKNRDNTSFFNVYTTKVDGTLDFFNLNTTNAKTNATEPAPTSTVFSVSNFNELGWSGNDYITYAWHSVEGFSKFGSYTGNGSADGPFVYTGFKPAFIIFKRTDAVSSWGMFDNKRDPDNLTENMLYPNGTDVEVQSRQMDMLSNGFKPRNTSADANASGGTYIYMAFAEDPFKYSDAR